MIPLRQLTFDGINDLFLFPKWGAVTKEHAAYLETLRHTEKKLPKIIPISLEMEMWNERYIETYGCGVY